MNQLNGVIINVVNSFNRFTRAIRRYHSHRSRWRMMNKNGQNRKERLRNQVALKGRRCKKRSGYKTHR